MALKMVARYFGAAVAGATAKLIEYPYLDNNARRVKF
jgi:hypothetical protein